MGKAWAVTTGMCWLAGAGAALGAEPLSFQRDVLPILERHCVECHSGWFPKGGLRLDSLAKLRQGGNSGLAIVPGRPDKGYLPFVLSQRQGRLQMPPPPAPPLSEAELGLLRAWLEQGAAP